MTAAAVGLSAAAAEEPTGIARKALVPLVILLSLAFRPTPLRSLRETLGWPRAGLVPKVAWGFAIGILSLALIDLVLALCGFRGWQPEKPVLELLPRLFFGIVAALVLGALEESFFRGALHGDLERASGKALALPIGALVFGVAHFLRPPKSVDSDLAPLRVALDCFAGVAEAFGPRWKELVGLVLVGWSLGFIRVRAGHIAWSWGIHAGWVFVRTAADKLLVEHEARVDEHVLWVGTMRHYDGVLGWVTLVIAGLLVGVLLGRGRPSGGSRPKPR